LTDNAVADISFLFAFEPRIESEWQLDHYGWRIALSTIVIVVSVALATVFILDRLHIVFSENVVYGAEALIWFCYFGVHIFVIGETLWKYFRTPKVTLDRDAVLYAYQYLQNPLENTLHQTIMITMSIVLAISGRFVSGLALLVSFGTVLYMEKIAINRIREAIWNAA
jgi:hypothetical protein